LKSFSKSGTITVSSNIAPATFGNECHQILSAQISRFAIIANINICSLKFSTQLVLGKEFNPTETVWFGIFRTYCGLYFAKLENNGNISSVNSCSNNKIT
jgi:hypothetical protein